LERSAPHSAAPGRGADPDAQTRHPIRACDLGLVAYDEALTLQHRLATAKKEGRIEADLLLLMEHPPVLTYGRNSAEGHLLEDAEALEAIGIRRVEIDRGGDVTYHGPGQLVGYPIFDLAHFRRDLHWYLRRVERALIAALAALGIAAARAEGLTGVWVGEGLGERPDTADALDADLARTLVHTGEIRKIASIGIHASRWVTTHGFALNRDARALEGFRWIVPCGIRGVTVTSLETEGLVTSAETVREAVIRGFEEAFGSKIGPADPESVLRSAD
jgi:lipoyl(octanoyl) transferase